MKAFKRLRTLIGVLTLFLAVQSQADEKLLYLEEPNFKDFSCLDKIAGLYQDSSYGGSTSFIENLKDGSYRQASISIESWCYGRSYSLEGPTESVKKIGPGKIESSGVFSSRTDIYCDKNGRLVTRTIKYEGGTGIKILGRVGRPSMEVVYNIDEVVSGEGGSKRLEHSVGWEHYYLVNYLKRKKDLIFESNEPNVQNMLQDGKLIKLKAVKGDGASSMIEFRNAKANEKEDFWGHADNPPHSFGIGHNDLKKPNATKEDFDKVVEVTKADPRIAKKTEGCGGHRPAESGPTPSGVD